MRRVLMAATIIAGFWSGSAMSQVPVTDAGSLFQQIRSYVQELKSYGSQLQQLQQEIQTAESTFQTLNSLVQNPSLGGAMGLMNRAGLGSALPLNPYSVQSLVSGSSGLSGRLGALSGLTNSSFNSNLIYSCTDNSWACEQQKRNAVALAGHQGIGMASIQSLADHVPVLQALRDRLATSNTPAERENAIAALQTESAWAQQEGNRLMAANILISSQKDIRDQQANEKLSKDLESSMARYGQR